MNNEKKIAEWTQIYLKHIDDVSISEHVKSEEGYKFAAVEHFQKYFNIDAVNLYGMLDSSILNNNLVVGAQYWPRKMILIYAQLFPEETRAALRILFNESLLLTKRITDAKEAFDHINELRNKKTGESSHTYIGLRFLSLLLGYRFPSTCNALKPAEWKVFARFINSEFAIPNRTAPGDQYHAYEVYIEELRVYLKGRAEIQTIKNALTKGLVFQDDEFRWTTQDVIYVTARIIANKRSNEVQVPASQTGNEIEKDEIIGDDNENVEDNTGFMPLESHLEEYIVKNWDLIDFGEKLLLYRDEDGTPGQQYVTDVGIIDILAKDEKGNFVVIELKRSESGYKAVGQVLNYMGWVQDKLASKGQKVRGMIVVGQANETLKSALRMVSDKISVKEYKLKMNLVNPK